MTQEPYASNAEIKPQLKTIPTFLALFIFGFMYELVLVWDALRVKNTIQVIGLCIANLALMVYSAIQIDQLQEAITILKNQNAVSDLDVWTEVQGVLIAIPCIIGVATIALGFISWKLYQEFAWDILKHIGADYRMKKRFLHYQVRPCHRQFPAPRVRHGLTHRTDLYRTSEVRFLLLRRFHDPVPRRCCR